jgi:hypothetical protein
MYQKLGKERLSDAFLNTPPDLLRSLKIYVEKTITNEKQQQIE